MKKLSVVAICLTWSQWSLGQDMAIVNARIIDGSGRVIENGGIAVADGRIAEIGDISIQDANVLTIDAGGMTAMRLRAAGRNVHHMKSYTSSRSRGL